MKQNLQLHQAMQKWLLVTLLMLANPPVNTWPWTTTAVMEGSFREEIIEATD